MSTDEIRTKHAAIYEAVNERRASVIDAITEKDPMMADEDIRAEHIAAAEEAAMSGLFERGETDPRNGIGANYIRWLADRELWSRFQEALGKPFPFEDQRPKLRDVLAAARCRSTSKPGWRERLPPLPPRTHPRPSTMSTSTRRGRRSPPATTSSACALLPPWHMWHNSAAVRATEDGAVDFWFGARSWDR